MDILIDRKEIARYLGYKKEIPDDKINFLIENAIEETEKIVSLKSIYHCYDIELLPDNEIKLLGTTCIFKGKHISKHLSSCKKIVVMAATIGIQIDRNIKLLESVDMTKAVIFNAVATTYIEALCDAVQSQIQEKYKEDGFCITNRFSPGYGDFDISKQKDIAMLLKTNTKIGLTVTETGLSIPFKSVTAIIGLYTDEEKDEKNNHKCKNCNINKSCDFTINED